MHNRGSFIYNLCKYFQVLRALELRLIGQNGNTFNLNIRTLW